MDPSASAISSSITTIIRLVEFGLHYAEVCNETRELLYNIDLVNGKINIAKNLRSAKETWLDNHIKANVDHDISIAEEAVKSIGITIEGCRVDLQSKQTVSALNRLKWLLRDNQAFLSKERTLSNSLQALNTDILIMNSVGPSSDAPPPAYDAINRFRVPLRSPASRLRLRKQRSESSLASWTEFSEEKIVSETQVRHIQTHDGRLTVPNETDCPLESETSMPPSSISHGQKQDVDDMPPNFSLWVPASSDYYISTDDLPPWNVPQTKEDPAPAPTKKKRLKCAGIR